jgi:hypothetical protein
MVEEEDLFLFAPQGSDIWNLSLNKQTQKITRNINRFLHLSNFYEIKVGKTGLKFFATFS